MAKAKGNIQFTGSMGNVSAYTRRGSDTIILRTKGGASKQQIRQSPVFAHTRLLNTEWSGCTKAGSYIREAMGAVKHLADYPFSGTLNGLAKKVQSLDTEHPLGQRAICFSKVPQALEGFNLNRQHPFDSVVKRPVAYSLFRDTGSANMVLPALLPEIHLYHPWKYSYYRFIVGLGVAPNLHFTDSYPPYQPLDPFPSVQSVSKTTSWQQTKAIFEEQHPDIALPNNTPLPDSYTLILTIGIEFGDLSINGQIEPVRYAGCAKVLATA